MAASSCPTAAAFAGVCSLLRLHTTHYQEQSCVNKRRLVQERGGAPRGINSSEAAGGVGGLQGASSSALDDACSEDHGVFASRQSFGLAGGQTPTFMAVVSGQFPPPPVSSPLLRYFSTLAGWHECDAAKTKTFAQISGSKFLVRQAEYI